MTGYRLRPFTPEDRRETGWVCFVRGCPHRPTYWAGTEYVRGRKARWSERRLCDGHASRFAKRYSLTAGVL